MVPMTQKVSEEKKEDCLRKRRKSKGCFKMAVTAHVCNYSY
jgi:hypothetical protein